MYQEESRQPTGQEVALAYKVTVSETIIELLQTVDAIEFDGDEETAMNNLKALGGHIQRHIIEPYSEMISLAMNDEITHVGKVWREGDNILHVILTADEIKNGGKQIGS